MSKKQDTIWEAKPHTLAKLKILSGYLQAYFPILGRSPANEILIIDGFAGPDKYTNHPHGSPSAAINVAKDTLYGLGGQWKTDMVHLAFIERNRRRFAHLKQRLDERGSLPDGIKLHLYNATFQKGLEQIKLDIPRPFETKSPLFVFIDPFGAKGAPFSIIADLLKSQCSEILLNLDADGISRIFKAGEHAKYKSNLSNLTDIFGDQSWEEKITANDTVTRCQQIRDLYLEKLRSLPNVKYVYSFAMHTTGKSVNYHLVFACQHHRGLEKMKGAMKKLDQDGSFKFADDRYHNGQPELFRFDDPEEYAPLMHQTFSDQRVTFEETRDYALNYTPFINSRKCLALLEKEKKIKVEAKNLKRIRGTFVDGDIIAITFAPYSPALF